MKFRKTTATSSEVLVLIRRRLDRPYRTEKMHRANRLLLHWWAAGIRDIAFEDGTYLEVGDCPMGMYGRQLLDARKSWPHDIELCKGSCNTCHSSKPAGTGCSDVFECETLGHDSIAKGTGWCNCLWKPRS